MKPNSFTNSEQKTSLDPQFYKLLEELLTAIKDALFTELLPRLGFDLKMKVELSSSSPRRLIFNSFQPSLVLQSNCISEILRTKRIRPSRSPSEGSLFFAQERKVRGVFDYLALHCNKKPYHLPISCTNKRFDVSGQLKYFWKVDQKVASTKIGYVMKN